MSSSPPFHAESYQCQCSGDVQRDPAGVGSDGQWRPLQCLWRERLVARSLILHLVLMIKGTLYQTSTRLLQNKLLQPSTPFPPPPPPPFQPSDFPLPPPSLLSPFPPSLPSSPLHRSPRRCNSQHSQCGGL